MFSNRYLLFLIILKLLLTDPLNAKPTRVKDVGKALELLKAELDAPKKNGIALRSGTTGTPWQKDSRIVKSRTNSNELLASVNSNKRRISGVRTPTRLEEDSRIMKSRANENDAESSITENLSKMTSNAKDSVVNAISSVVNPIDEYTRKAVNGVGLVIGIANGIATGIGTQAFNSMVRVHNTNMDNLTKLKDLTKNVGHSVVDLGSTVVSETVNVLDTVRKENNRLLKKATDSIPVVRHLVSLKDVAELAATSGMSTFVKGTRRLGDLAIDVVNLRKAKELEEGKGGLGDLMSGMTGLSDKTADSLINTFGSTKGMSPMLRGLVTDNGHEAAYEIGNFIGSTVGAAKLAKVVGDGNVGAMFTK